MSHIVPSDRRDHAELGPAGHGRATYGGETVDLREVMAVLRRHAAMILAIAVLITGLSAYYVLRQPAEFSAGAIIRLKDVRGAITAGTGDAGMEALMLGRQTDPLLSELEILESPAVATEVVDLLGLRLQRDGRLGGRVIRDVRIAPELPADTVEIAFAADRVTLTNQDESVSGGYGEPLRLDGLVLTAMEKPAVDRAELFVLSPGDALDAFLERLVAIPREKTNVVDVQYTALDPVLAQEVVNATVQAYQRLNTGMAQQQSRRRRAFVEDQLASTDSVLATAQHALSGFREREAVYSSGERFAAEQSALTGVDVRREELDAERRMYEALIARVRAPGAESGDLRALVSAPGISDNAMVQELSTRLIGYRKAVDSMTTGTFAASPNNPDVRRLEALIVSTRSELIGAVEGHIESVRARIASLDDLKRRATTEIQGLPTAEAEEVRLTLQLETAKKIADQLREEYQKARVAEAVEAGQVEVLSLAPLPSRPVPAHRSLKVMVGLVVGLLLGSGGAFLREHLNRSIGRKEDVDVALRIPTLGIVPRIVAEGEKGARARFLRGVRRGTGVQTRERLVTALQQTSSSAEAYRTLRTNLIFSQAVQTLGSIAVTSSSASEGKTTTAANLAVAFAQQGKRVILVDCDLRRPRIHRMFCVPSTPGLTHLVLNHLTLGEVVRATAVEGLFILPAGDLPPNPSELLGSERMRAALGTLCSRWDVVILDTTPMLAAADAAVLGSFVDGVLLVIRAGRTERGAAQYALEQLRGVGARVVGAVLNDPDAKVPAYGGYYGYYQYAYGESGVG